MTLVPFDLEQPRTFSNVTHVGQGRISTGSVTSPSQGGGGLSVPQIFGTSYMHDLASEKKTT